MATKLIYFTAKISRLQLPFTEPDKAYASLVK